MKVEVKITDDAGNIRQPPMYAQLQITEKALLSVVAI